MHSVSVSTTANLQALAILLCEWLDALAHSLQSSPSRRSEELRHGRLLNESGGMPNSVLRAMLYTMSTVARQTSSAVSLLAHTLHSALSTAGDCVAVACAARTRHHRHLCHSPRRLGIGISASPRARAPPGTAVANVSQCQPVTLSQCGGGGCGLIFPRYTILYVSTCTNCPCHVMHIYIHTRQYPASTIL